MNKGVDLGSISRETLALIAAIAAGIAVIQALASAFSRWRKKRRLALRMERAAAGEERAAALLEAKGYEILGAQVAVEHSVLIDGRTVVIGLRADYLVLRDGARYVVEVKTGAVAPRIETSATRRQVLEYRIAFDVDGVVLVDAEAGAVHEVTFPALARHVLAPAPSSGQGWRVFALAIAAVVAALLLLR